MAIITWIENGIKQYAVFDAKYFAGQGHDFPVFESHRRSFNDIIAIAENEVVMVSGDRKRYRMVQSRFLQHAAAQQPPRKSTKIA